jgi:hypothetical protein
MMEACHNHGTRHRHLRRNSHAARSHPAKPRFAGVRLLLQRVRTAETGIAVTRQHQRIPKTRPLIGFFQRASLK